MQERCAFHCVLSLCMPLCVSLSTFPAHASMHTFPARASTRFTVYFPCASSMHFTLYLPYACLYAFYCLPSLRMLLCISLSTFPVHHLCISLSLPLCISRLLCLCMPLCISLSTFSGHYSTHFTVYSPCACIYALASVLSLGVPLCISLYTFPADEPFAMLSGKTIHDRQAYQPPQIVGGSRSNKTRLNGNRPTDATWPIFP